MKIQTIGLVLLVGFFSSLNSFAGDVQNSIMKQGCLTGILGHWSCTSNLWVIKECQTEYPNSDYGQRLCEIRKEEGLMQAKKKLHEILESKEEVGSKTEDPVSDDVKTKEPKINPQIAEEKNDSDIRLAVFLISILGAFAYIWYLLRLSSKRGNSDSEDQAVSSRKEKAIRAQKAIENREYLLVEEMRTHHSRKLHQSEDGRESNEKS